MMPSSAGSLQTPQRSLTSPQPSLNSVENISYYLNSFRLSRPVFGATRLGFMLDSLKSTERFDFAYTSELCVCLLLWSRPASRYDVPERLQTRLSVNPCMQLPYATTRLNTSESPKLLTMWFYLTVRCGSMRFNRTAHHRTDLPLTQPHRIAP